MKKDWQKIDSISHRAVIAGQVTDATTKQPVSRATVTLTKCPPALSARLRTLAELRGDDWEDLAERLDRTMSAWDGSYRFIDLPVGDYEITALGPNKKHGDKTAEVSVDEHGEIVLRIVNIEVAKTG